MAQPWLSHQKSQAVTLATAGFISAWLDRLVALKPSRGNSRPATFFLFSVKFAKNTDFSLNIAPICLKIGIHVGLVNPQGTAGSKY
jgi:hypothetical protein